MSLAERLARQGRPDRLEEVRARIQQGLVEGLGPRLYDTSLSEPQLEELVTQRLRELIDRFEVTLSAQEKTELIRQITDSVLGLG
ncbi:MAG TPA: hypothetical protein VHJ82_04285, partial [Actinomycetota bacterium]|nr:hypothetical protein [Actinomycetota bacterium]